MALLAPIGIMQETTLGGGGVPAQAEVGPSKGGDVRPNIDEIGERR